VPSAALFVESFRPGTLEAMGLGPDKLLEKNPEARGGAHLGLGAGRALSPPARASAR
jgi:crotonobetainyl-CoA:carnitine CoA-transferase CaiB-like acyl-CoA transferase